MHEVRLMSRIVYLGKVVADIYRDESTSPIEMPFAAVRAGRSEASLP
jgi:hypothetical protein